jgi:hypothetical protein
MYDDVETIAHNATEQLLVIQKLKVRVFAALD